MSAERILGYAPLEGLDRLLAVLNAEPGPAVMAWHGTHLAALLQTEVPDRPAARYMVRDRLAAACLAGPFLPQDPAAAVVPTDTIPALFAPAWEALEAALWTHGTQRQWDITLRWFDGFSAARRPADAVRGPAKATDSAMRTARLHHEAAALNVLAPAVLALTPCGSCGTEVRITALADAGAVDGIEMALHHLDDVSFDLDGPMPPVAFAAVRVVMTDAAEADGAGRAVVNATESDDRVIVHRQWRTLATALWPDRQANVLAAALSGIGGVTDAEGMGRPVVSAGDARATPEATPRTAARRLVVPDPPYHAQPSVPQPIAPRPRPIAGDLSPEPAQLGRLS